MIKNMLLFLGFNTSACYATLFAETVHRSCHACFTEIAITLPEWYYD